MAIVDMKLEWLRQGRIYDIGGGLLITAKRSDIFADPHPLVMQTYPKEFCAIGPLETDLNLLIISGYDISVDPVKVMPIGVPCKMVGDPNYGTSRRVYEYIGKESGLDFRLGLTIHEARGTWSSGPHDFELEAMKSLKPMKFWEQFAYITDPPNDWGIQTRQGFLNGEFMQDVQIIRDRDILDIPLGVHHVTAGPGVRLAYIWIYQAEDISAAEKF